jgi:hypothetical protein
MNPSIERRRTSSILVMMSRSGSDAAHPVLIERFIQADHNPNMGQLVVPKARHQRRNPRIFCLLLGQTIEARVGGERCQTTDLAMLNRRTEVPNGARSTGRWGSLAEKFYSPPLNSTNSPPASQTGGSTDGDGGTQTRSLASVLYPHKETRR